MKGKSENRQWVRLCLFLLLPVVLQQCQHALDLLLHNVALLQEDCPSVQEVLEESLHNRSIQCKQKG